MTLDDYVAEFEETSIAIKSLCDKNNKHDLVRTNLLHTIGRDDTMQVFKITLSEDIDCKQYPFSISLIQQGKRLQNYRLPEKNGQQFTESRFTMILVHAKDGKVGEYISHSKDEP